MTALAQTVTLSDGNTIEVIRAKARVVMEVLRETAFKPQETSLERDGKNRLTEWAKWQKGGQGLGYRAVEPFAAIITPTPGNLILGPMPPEIALTDRAVCVLRYRSRSMLWSAIEEHFLCNDAAPVKWKRMGKTRMGFYRLVDRACAQIMLIIRDLPAEQ